MDDEIKRPHYKDCDGILIPGCFSREAFRSAVSYKPKPDDLFVVTYPKCGTTWMQQILYLIHRKGKPSNDFLEVLRSSPFLEFVGADSVDFMIKPGAIKIHLPFNLTPYSPDAKYIYIARNPKDCCVSFFYHTKNGNIYNFSDGTFDEFFELFINGQTDYGDYFDHLLSWYKHKDDSNVFFITYEKLKEDPRSHILKIAKFMGDEYYDSLVNNPDILENVLKYSGVEYMKTMVNEHFNKITIKPEGIPLPSGLTAFFEYLKAHPKLSPEFQGEFVRKGIVGDWKSHFSPEQEKRMQERIKEKTSGTDVMSLWED